jgi:predicted O-methyltransferase YrrM
MTTSPGAEAPRRNPIERALSGWQIARVVMSANRLDFFNAIGEGALTAEEIAARCSTHPRGTRTLLNACVSLSILIKEGDKYRNGPEALDMLLPGKPLYIGDGIKHQDDLWQAWGRLHEAVRTNKAVSQRYNLVEEPAVHRNFILAMHDNARRVAPFLSRALDLTDRKQLFDAGGGPGTHSIALVKRYAGLRAIVFDLPQTIEIAREIIAGSGVADRISTRAGNYFQDDFGQGNDVVLLSAILHSMGPERSKGLLKKAFDSLVPGGIVVVHEGLISEDGTRPLSAVLFCLNMLVNTGEGQSYSGAEIMGLMGEVGFTDSKVLPLPEPMRTSLVVGKKG